MFPPFAVPSQNGWLERGLALSQPTYGNGLIILDKAFSQNSRRVAWSNGYDISFTTEHVPRWF
jgi:hypothetical protein